MKARDAVEDALREINVLGVGEAMPAEHIQHGMRRLGQLLLAWQNLDYNVWLKAEQTLTLTTARSYTLSPERPLRILGARIVGSGLETPMQELMRQDYDDLPNKTSTGRPTSYYYDRQREDALFYVWPVLSVANGETVKITYARPITTPDALGEDVDIPPEWELAVVKGLAADLAATYEKPAPADAALHLGIALGFDREGSVFFT